MNSMSVITIYILTVSVIAFSCFGIDKWKAANHRWRIKEATLIGLCIIGGSLGGFAGMYIFRHKTKKPLFFVGIPIILTAQILCFIILYPSMILPG